jgi:uncharacterized protein (TIGR00266 family)
MKYSIHHRPFGAFLQITLNEGETVFAQPGSMAAMRGEFKIDSSIKGGLFQGLLRKLAGGETLFINSFTALTDSTLYLAPANPGDVEYVEVNGAVFAMDSTYLAHHGEVEISVAWKGLRGLIGGSGLLWLNFKGKGGVWVSGFGALHKIVLKEGERLTVDNYHLVCASSTVGWSVRTFSSNIKSFLFGGEFLVMDLVGPGEVLLSTRTLPPFAQMVARFLPTKNG